ncbi:MAG TPA: MFS transporter [Tepidisphaeraceae bacterium]
MATPVPITPSGATGGLGLFRALRSRNYRLFFIGQGISLIGTFLTQIATIWLVYHITSDERWLGTVAFAGQIALFFLAPFGGVLVDRWNKRNLLVVTQILSMLQSLALAALMLTNVRVWEIVVLAFVQGLINCFDMPARQAFTVEMVENREDLANAIALNSTMVHTARLMGPALGGFLLYKVGPGLCFLIDGLSYIAVIVCLVLMHVQPNRPKARGHSVLHELHEGIVYAWSSVPIRVLLLLMAVISLTGMPAFNILMPVFARALGGLRSDAQTLGLLMAVSGAGALACAVFLASRRTVVGLGRFIAIAGVTFGAALIAFAFSRQLWLSMLIAPVAGFGMLANFASANTLLQTLADDDKRGRVMSLFTVAFIGVAPFGNLLAGFAARHFGGAIAGASQAVMVAGLIVIVAAAFWAAMLPNIRKIIRPIYVQKGIIREVATGLGNAAGPASAQSEVADGAVVMNREPNGDGEVDDE